MRNPITNEEFTDANAYAQSLIDSYANAQKEKYQVKQDEDALVEALNELAAEPDIKKGTIKVQGTTHVAKVVRKLNASYPKERGAEHPLRKLLGRFENLGPMIDVSYKEKGSVIQGLIDRLAGDALALDDDKELVEAIDAVRTEKAGKPSITLQERVDTPV